MDQSWEFEQARRRKAARRAQDERRAKAARKKRRTLWALCGTLTLVLAVLAAVILLLDRPTPNPLLQSVTVEAGSEVEPEQFLGSAAKLAGSSAYFDTNMSAIDMTVDGDHTVKLWVDGALYSSTLQVRDRVAPKADPVDMTIDVGMLPSPEYLVKNIRDAGTVTVTYKQTPDVSEGGKVVADILLTDGSGNTAVVQSVLTVVSDKVPPVIKNAVDRRFFVGDPIVYTGAYEDPYETKYLEILATDEESEVQLIVDRDAVDPEKAGSYPVTYIAVDSVGNTTKITVQFILEDKPEGFVSKEEVLELARQVLDTITTEEMSDMEVAFAIYKWTSTNIGYVGTSDKSSWINAAYQAFTQYSGDCYNYFAAAKAMYEVAGIKNVDVVKSDTTHSAHYWSIIDLGDGWYHVDCTPRSNPGQFFMNTDAELEAYSVVNRNSHIFESDLYPERATESVQHLVDYANGVILEG